MVFYVAIITFISSVIAGIVLTIIYKKVPLHLFYMLLGIHLIFLFGFIASLIIQKAPAGPGRWNYFFLAFVCSGVVFSGMLWRSEAPLPFRIYFVLFTATIAMFLFSPSMTVNFLLTTKYTTNLGPSYLITGNYYIESQSMDIGDGKIPHYKLVKKRGLFHQTIARDLDFKGTLDSVRLLDFRDRIQISLRGYSSVTTYVSTIVDSTDLDIPLTRNRQNEIEYKL